MRIYRFLSLTLLNLFITLSICGQPLNEFKSLLDQCGMNVTIPSGFVECPIIVNHDMEYNYALKYPDKEFEVRYAVRPITYKTYANDSVRDEMEGQRYSRNSSYLDDFQTIILKITGGTASHIREFTSEAVNSEFNADWGATTFVELNSFFGKGYNYCMIVTIHKTDMADAYYFYLSDSRENYAENTHPFFHSLMFD